MVGKDFRSALREGKKVYGTQISSTSPKMFDSVISLGLDFVFFCNEHVQYNPETLSWMCNAFKAAGVNPLVRILEPSPYLATQALDAGACTVLVPYVEEIEDVIALIGITIAELGNCERVSQINIIIAPNNTVLQNKIK